VPFSNTWREQSSQVLKLFGDKYIHLNHLPIKHLPHLDILRAYAVLSVLFGHWVTNNGAWLHKFFNAKAGVTIFFVLSGYLISRILFREKDKETPLRKALGVFYLRRALRISPIYYLTLIFVWIIGAWPENANIWPYFLYFQNVQYVITGSWDGVNSHLWSLAVEEQFYLFWPLIILIVPQRWLLRTIVFTIAVGPFSRLMGMEWLTILNGRPEMVHVLTPTTFDCFGLGAILAYFEMYRPGSYQKFIRSSKPLVIGIVGVVLYLLLGNLREGVLDDVFERLAISLWCVYLIPLNHKIDFSAFHKTKVSKALQHVGKVSYGIYLFHPYVKLTFESFNAFLSTHSNNDYLMKIITALQDRKIQFVLLTIITIGLASISWRLIESPINRLKKYVPYS
jgi:peptidoglycan/LPS O-acetylase OafA/YrhL